jgi:hypothetical protein
VLRDILGEELGQELATAVDFEKFLNARLEYDVLAGTHMAAKKAMQASLPLMVQILENPQIIQQLAQTGYVVDILELLKMIMEMSEWKNSRNLVRRRTPQEEQSFQAANQAQQKLQGQMALEQQKFGHQQQLTDQQAEARLASSVIENSLDKATGQEFRAEDRAAMEGGQ